MLEIEKTYLIKSLPEGLETCKYKELIDFYLPKNSDHPKMRIRKNGDKYVITKKNRVNENDGSTQIEENIHLTEEEFLGLTKNLEAKKIHKRRYYYPWQGHTIEIDVFMENLKGLIMADIEVDSQEIKDQINMPNFCLSDITDDTNFAGGILCGKNYEDIENHLNNYGYQKIEFNG